MKTHHTARSHLLFEVFLPLSTALSLNLMMTKAPEESSCASGNLDSYPFNQSSYPHYDTCPPGVWAPSISDYQEQTMQTPVTGDSGNRSSFKSVSQETPVKGSCRPQSLTQKLGSEKLFPGSKHVIKHQHHLTCP